MATPEPPPQASSPNKRQLLKSAMLALGIAAVVLVCVVLPAEYAIDPTGVGSRLGLTPMRQASGGAVVLKDTLAGNADIGKGTIADAGEPLPLPNPAVHTVAALPAKNATLTITLPIGGAREVKAVLRENQVITYSWGAEQGLVYVDFHGHSPDWPDKRAFVRYLEAADGATGGNGSLVAPFSGEHGWYWANLSDHPATLTLRISGYYDEIKDYGAL